MAGDGLRPLFEETLRLLQANSEVLILGHKDADGDTLGCSLAFAEALRSQGKTVWVVMPPPLPEMYAWLPGFDQILDQPPPGADPGLVIFFDVGNMERSGSAVRHIASHATIINVDHHTSNSLFGDVNIIDPSPPDGDASAVGQTVLKMLDHFGYPLTPTIATNIYTALMTDTGGFRHENTTAKALDDAARLARAGADPGRIATMVYKSRPLTTLKLSALSIATLQVDQDGRLAWAKVTRSMLREAKAVMAESEGIIDTLNSIAGLDLAILFKEVGPSMTKISVRSRGEVDAAALSAEFGGGGHQRAAGAEIPRPMPEAIEAVLQAARAALKAGVASGLANPDAGRNPQSR